MLLIYPAVLLPPDGRGHCGDGPVLTHDELFQPLLQGKPPTFLHLVSLLALFEPLRVSPDKLLGVLIDSVIDSGVPIVIGLEGVGPGLQQDVDSSDVVRQGCVVERGAAPEVGPGTQSVTELVLAAYLDLQRVLPLLPGGGVNVHELLLRVHLGPRPQQQTDDLLSAPDSRQVQRGPAQLVAPSHIHALVLYQSLDLCSLASLDRSE